MTNPSRTIHQPEWAQPLYRPHRYKVLFGGRGSAKTWSMAAALAVQGHQKPLRIACVRQFQNSIEESNKQTFETMIDRMGLSVPDGYTIQKQAILHANGTRIFFRGISTTTEAAIKGWENVDRVWIEQAEMMSASAWEILKNTIRKPGSEIWLSFNPKNRYDPAYRDFVGRTREDAFIRKVNYQDNPWFPAELEGERRFDEQDNPERYPHIWLGEPDDVSAARKVLPYAMLAKCRDAWDRRPKEDGVPHAGLDVADTGADKNALAIRRMCSLLSVDRWSAPTLGHTTRRADRAVQEAGAVRLYYDAGGVGAGVRSHLADMGVRPYQPVPVHFGGEVAGPDVLYVRGATNKQYFKNRAAQMGMGVKFRANLTVRLVDGDDVDPSRCLFINPAIPQLEDIMAQLAQPEWNDDTGKLRVEKQPHAPGESKPPSPDGYDCVILSCAADSRKGLRRP